MYEGHNPYAVSAVLKREAEAKDPVFPPTASPLESLNFSSDLRVNQIGAQSKAILGLDSAASEEQLVREIRLHHHVDEFIKNMQKIVKTRFKHPLLGKIFAQRAELRIPLEYLNTEREIEVFGGKAQLKLALINSSLLTFNAAAMALINSKNIPVFPAFILSFCLIQAHMCIRCFAKYNKLKNKIVRLPASLNSIKNSSVKRLLTAVRSHGFYTKYCYDHDCIRIELSNKPQELPVAKDLDYQSD